MLLCVEKVIIILFCKFVSSFGGWRKQNNVYEERGIILSKRSVFTTESVFITDFDVRGVHNRY